MRFSGKRLNASVILGLLLTASTASAEWQLVKGQTRVLDGEPNGAKPSILFEVEIRNASSRTLFVWGTDWIQSPRYYQVEYYIQNSPDAEWERENAGMCGSYGRIGWLDVKPGESFKWRGTVLNEQIGRPVMLTFRRALTELDSKGSEVLLGPLKIPAPINPRPTDLTTQTAVPSNK